MDVEQAVNRPISDSEKKAKENSSAAGNHGDAHMNGMSNGFDRRKEHKSERKDKERSHKSEHRDKDRRDKEKSHKSEHKSKDRDKHKHSSSNGSKDKDKHSSNSSSSSSKDKDKKSSSSSSKDKEKEHKSSSVSSATTKDKEKDKDKNRDHHKSSLSSKDKEKDREKDKYHSSSKVKESSKSKDKDRHHSDSSRDKDKSVSKDKDRRHSSSKDKEKHSSSHSSSDKDKKSDRDRHRHDKDKDRHRRDKDKEKSSRSREDREKEEIKEEPVIKEEPPSQIYNNSQSGYEDVDEKNIKNEQVSQIEDDDDDSNEPGLYIKEEDDDDEANDEYEDDKKDIKQNDDEDEYDENDDDKDNDEDYKQEENSSDGNDTRLSDLHNTTLKTEEESDEDIPLSVRKSASKSKRKNESSDDEEDIPLSARKKAKKESVKKKKKRKHSDDEDDEPEEKPKKRKSKTATNNPSPKKKKKEEEEAEVWKWWEEEKKSDGTKWAFLEHKGPVFAPPYEPLPPSVKFYYNGKEMKLSEPTEEVATFYARMLDHDYTTKKIFNDNFFKDWREVMTESERAKIMDLSKCNFREMHTYFLQKSEERKAMTKEEKKAIKEKNDEIAKEYGFCTIDGHKEKIGNFKIEPPGLFRGRGEHPKMGKLKKRVMPEDVLINCSKTSVIPKPPPGHKWKEVRHDPTVTWLASWTENIQGQVKYVMLNPSSKLKGEKDWQKYETARKLAKSIDKIRAEYREDWKSKEMRIRQRAVALYFIDKLALRAGNEKDEDQADTVGCCSLRVEHISLHEQKDGKEYVVVFDFLGKDSIRYYNEVPVEKRVFKNLQLFKENKSDGDDLFDRLNTTVMNKHLNELMEGLTAKVFRTYNASWTLQQQLDKLTNPDDTVAEKILSYNRANRAVAILCNHQRSVPKTHAKSMENLKAKITAKKEAIKEAEEQVKDAKKDSKHGSVKAKELYEKAKKKLEKLKEQLTKLEVQATDREENKEIALGTSKLNYLDPRITVAWCKKHGVPIEKIYNKTQRDKFRWAIDMAGPDYVF